MARNEEDLLTITVEGKGVRPGRIKVAALTIIGEAMQSALERVTLVLHSGTSQRRGPLPKEIRDVTSIELAGIERGSVKLLFEATPANLGSEHFVARAANLLVEGMAVVIDKTFQGEMPTGFDYGVVNALKPLGGLPAQFGIDVISVRAPSGNQQKTTLNDDDWNLFMAIEPPTQPRASRVVGRLLEADLKNHRCRVYDTGGRSHHLVFDPALDVGIKNALKQWVDVEVTPDQDDLASVLELTVITDDEADEMSPPRTAPWPRSVIETMKAAAARAHGAMEARPRLAEYKLED